MAEQNAYQQVQIHHMETQSALDAERNRIMEQQATLTARQLEEQQSSGTPVESQGAEATRQALDKQLQRIEATQAAVAQAQAEARCAPSEIPPYGGSQVSVGEQVCIPAEAFAWISSDPAHITIPGVYDNGFGGKGFTFAFFGPARFTISGVRPEYVRLDVRPNTDTSLYGNFDGKSVNLVYRGGKVCDRAVYDIASACP